MTDVFQQETQNEQFNYNNPPLFYELPEAYYFLVAKWKLSDVVWKAKILCFMKIWFTKVVAMEPN